MKINYFLTALIGIIISCAFILSSCEKEEEPVADFSAKRTTITEGNSTRFTDESTNNPTSWTWDFGDSSTSSKQNPSHTYDSSGIYTVELTVSNSAGSDTETKTDYITVEQKKPLKKIDCNGTLYVYPEDNSTIIEWGGYGIQITDGNGADSNTDGEANTSAIVSQLGADGHAAYLCDTLTAYGHSDWYLPAINELKAMYQNRLKIGGFNYSAYYWSSTESFVKKAWGQDFFNGTQGVKYKHLSYRVRCVRRD